MDLLRCVQRGRWLRLFRCRFHWFDCRRWRSRLHNSLNGWRRCRAECLLGLCIQGLAGICLQGLLLLRECDRRRWRRYFCHYRPRDYRLRGLRRSARSCGARFILHIRSHHAGLHRSHRRGVNRRTRRDRARKDFHRRLCHRLRVHESCSGHCRYGAVHSLIYIRCCLNVVVHHICDGGLLHNGIGNVHVGDIGRAGLTRGHVDFAWRQRKPCHAAAASEITRRI